MTQTMQVTNAIAKMKAAGYPRKDYSCRVDKYLSGEYGRVQITLWKIHLDLIPALVEQGLSVTRFYATKEDGTDFSNMSIQDPITGKAELTIVDYRKYSSRI